MRDLIELMEAEEYALLLENAQRASWLLQNFGPKLEERYAEQVENGSVPPVIQGHINAKDGETVAEKLISYIMEADPTQNKGYSRWITLRYLKDNQALEDISAQLRGHLELFARASAARRVNGNIDTIRTFHDLFTVIEPFVLGDREVSANADRKAKRDTKVDARVARQWDVDDAMRKQAKVLLDSDDYMVLIPATAEAACYFGKNTNWCTTSGMFQTYHKDGPLYIILRRRDNRRWQFHFETQQFMDERDRQIDLDTFIDENYEVFRAIGEGKFLLLTQIERKGYGFTGISLRHFSPEIINSQPINILAKMVRTVKDLKAYPQEKVRSEEFLNLLLDRIPNARVFNDEEGDPRKKAIIAFYSKVFRNAALWDALCARHKWLLKILPSEMQTDSRKIELANRLWAYSDFTYLIPTPWPKEVNASYWEAASKQKRSLWASDLPEDQRTESNLALCLANGPHDIPEFAHLMNEEMVITGVRHLIEQPARLDNYILEVPKHLLTKAVQKPIYEKAVSLKLKSESGDRDAYLEVLSHFPHDLWPWKASKVSGRLATVNPNFENNPEQFRNSRHAVQWIAKHPEKLSRLKPEYVTEEVVQTAILRPEDKPDKSSIAAHLRNVLGGCDPKIVKPEWVTPAIVKWGDLPRIWHSIPKDYLDRNMTDELLKAGAIPFGDERFPKDAFTPENIVARFNATVPYTVQGTIVKDNGNGKPYETQGEKPALTEIREAWESLPDNIDKKKTLIALVTSRGGKRNNSSTRSYQGANNMTGNTHRYGLLFKIVDKSLLDKEVLTAWLKSLDNYGEHQAKELFELFPESAHSAENMALAVKKSIIDKVPEHLQDDEVLVNQLANYNSVDKIDWKKITPALMIELFNKEQHTASSIMRWKAPKDHPMMFDPSLALTMLKKPKPSGFMSGIEDKELKQIYGEHPDRIKNWGQEQFDLAAGNIIAFKDIPQKFWSDTVKQRAIRTTPEEARSIPNVVSWLNENATDLADITVARLLSQGIARTDSGWIDISKLNRKTVPGVSGSYAFVDVQPQGQALMIFDEKGNCLDALMGDVAGTKTNVNYATSRHMLASELKPPERDYGSRYDGIPALRKYRRLIAAAFNENPEFVSKLPEYSHGGKSIRDLEEIWLYRENDRVIPVENMKRQTVGDNEVTYVKPAMDRYHSADQYFLFDGPGAMIGMVGIDKDGRGARVDSVRLNGEASMKRLCELSKGIADFLADRYIVSGNSPAFKETALYTKLGIRGPGKGEWYSLLDEKLSESGKYTIWRYGPRVTITDDTNGVVFSAKLSKTGYTVEYRSNTTPEVEKAMQKIIDNVRGQK